MSDDKNDPKKAQADSELDDLLESALQDMTKKDDKTDVTKSGSSDDANAQNMWSEEFIKEAASQFEANMAAILGNFGGVPEDQITQEQIAQTFTKMAEAAAQVLNQKPGDAAAPTDTSGSGETVPEPEKIDEVTAAISQTLQNLSSNAENLQTPFTDQDLANMFNNFNLEDGRESNMFLPFMQGMMQSLLSKEVLYPSLKELVDKYPTWLQENKGKIDQAEFDRYSSQMELMKKVCDELEPEQDSDPEDVKRKRFEIVLELMQKMQDLGQPPTELVGDIASAPTGFVAPTQDNAQCSVM